jgi:hypothetical protein
MLPIAVLRPSPHNARKHPEEQICRLAKIIREYGFITPVLIGPEYEIIAGHGRVEAAKRIGLGMVPTIRILSLTAAQRRAFAIADNRLAESGTWDFEILAKEFAILAPRVDVEVTGFTLEAIEIASLPAQEKASRRGKPCSKRTSPVSRQGDVWQLGSHLLTCGDAELSQCDQLIDRFERLTGARAQLTITGQTFEEVATIRAGSVAAVKEARS